VAKVDASLDKYNAQITTLEVLAGTVEGQEGRQLTHFLNLNDDGQYTKKHLRFALATGLIKPGEKKDEVDWTAAEGKQLVFSVEKRESKKDGKVYTQVSGYGLDLWCVDNPEVKDVPKNKEALKLRGQPKSQKPKEAEKDEWANIDL
jgi:hypothetical protein